MYSKYIFMVIIFSVFFLSMMFNKDTKDTFTKSKNQETALFKSETVMADSSNEQQNTSNHNLDVNKGEEIGSVYEAYLSPQQEPGEEENTPKLTPKAFKSTEPSTPRNQRKSRGHATLRFTKNLSKVYVDVKVEGVDVQKVSMFHIHCGKPDLLGPILVDFAFSGDIQKNLSDGIFSVELTNEDIEKVLSSKHNHGGVVAAFTLGCPIVPGGSDKVKTIAGMEHIARHSELYFNLHTKGQTYFGDMRGQIHPLKN